MYCDLNNNNDNEAVSKASRSLVLETKGIALRVTALAWFSALVRTGKGQSSHHTCGVIDLGVGKPRKQAAQTPPSGSAVRSTLRKLGLLLAEYQRTKHPTLPPFYFQAWKLVALG